MIPPVSRSRVVAALAVLTAAPIAAQRVSFSREIRPLLSDRCFLCHGPDASSREADLRLDRRADALEVLSPGIPDESELLRRVGASDPDERMPPTDAHRRPVSTEELGLLRRWIDQGAPYEGHWAYRPVVRPQVPAHEAARGPIDAFLGAAQAAASVRPMPLADDVTLVRRLSIDLCGLPPTPEDVATFVEDRRPDRYERLVDRLLASPRHAERMAVHWLDLVRFADTVGYHGDQEHHISPYRDYVLRAFRDNLPFDRFTREQLAGDLLPNPTVEQRTASGYNRVLQTSHEGGVQPKEYLAKYASDRVRNLGAVWLGATTGCAECHDHKFDPISQRDFYALAAFFADIEEKGDFKGAPNSSPTVRKPEIDVVTELDRERGGEPKPRRTMVTMARAEPRTVRVLPRGNWLDDSGEIVQPAAPHFLPQIRTEGRRADRLDLAAWLTSADNPLTARVFVNRIWNMLFGRGLSKVLDDLGAQGEPPTHPELLEWLAVEFIESGWDVRALLRRIVLSDAYRRASSADADSRDPDNRLFARQTRVRWPAEVVRDSALAISGLLVHRFGGPSVKPYQPAGYYAHLNFPKRRYKRDKGEALYRRSVYVHWQRQFLHPVLRAFDAPTREECVAKRVVSNSPAAALALLNAPEFVECARVFAARALREGGEDASSRVAWLWRQALSRDPSEEECELALDLVERHQVRYRDDPDAAAKLVATGAFAPAEGLDVAEHAAWTSVARVVLNLDEGLRRR